MRLRQQHMQQQIPSEFKAELKQAEEDIRAGTNRRVEAVVYRSAISTLEVEEK